MQYLLPYIISRLASLFQHIFMLNYLFLSQHFNDSYRFRTDFCRFHCFNFNFFVKLKYCLKEK